MTALLHRNGSPEEKNAKLISRNFFSVIFFHTHVSSVGLAFVGDEGSLLLVKSAQPSSTLGF